MKMMDLPELIILDIGHGNCAIVRDTEGVIVIDSAHGATLIETLAYLSIREISHILVSHADEDRIAGIIDLLLDRNIKVTNLSQKLGLKPRPYRTALLAEVKTLNLFHKDM